MAIYIVTFPRRERSPQKGSWNAGKSPKKCPKGSDFKDLSSQIAHGIFVVEDRLALQQDFLSASSVGRILALCSQEELPGVGGWLSSVRWSLSNRRCVLESFKRKLFLQ